MTLQLKQADVDLVGSTKFDRYKKQSIEATYNMLISDNALVDYAGYEKRINIGGNNSDAREIYRSVKFDHLIVIMDANVYVVDSNLSSALIGQLDTQSGPVSIAENNADQIAIVDGLNVYILNTDAETFDTISVDFRPVYIDFQDTYFIAADGNSNNWRLSGQNDGTSWPFDAQHVGELETKPDILVATVRFDRQLFIMGTKTTEIWHDTGGQLFPYQRDNSISIDYGCLNSQTVASGFGRLVWLGANEKAGPTIMYSDGGPVKQLSTDGINFILDKLTKPEDSTAFLFEEDGHVFYQITFFSDNVTYVYDFNTSKFFNITDHCLNAHIAKRIAFFNNTHYFISSIDGGLYELSTNFTTLKTTLDPDDDGHEIPRIRITKNFRLPDASKYVINQLSLTTETGQSANNMRIDLSLSKDGGHSFGTVLTKEVKPVANRTNRFRYWRLGASNDTVFQFRFWGKSRFVGIHATMEYFQ
ncbi:MAG: hypothetical protein ACPG47_00145 [Leucothrix sp.]